MGQGTFGRIRFENDFTALREQFVTTTTGDYLGGGIAVFGVNEGTIDTTIDEPGGILDITTDTGDDDNNVLVAAAFKPQDGGMWLEARIKIPDSVAATRAAAWVGFTETLSTTTPVMPFETATATTTYRGTGGMAGFGFDSDATVIDWRFGAGDGGAALATVDSKGTAGAAIGIRCNADVTADRWWIFRVEVDTAGIARGFFCDTGNEDKLEFIGRNTAALGTGDSFHAVVMIENRSAANERLEVDYMFGEGYRDWSAS